MKKKFHMVLRLADVLRCMVGWGWQVQDGLLRVCAAGDRWGWGVQGGPVCVLLVVGEDGKCRMVWRRGARRPVCEWCYVRLLSPGADVWACWGEGGGGVGEGAIHPPAGLLNPL